MKESTKGYIAAFSYSMIIGLSYMFVKTALNYASVLDILAHRFNFAFLCVFVPVLIGKIKLTILWQDVLRLLPLAFFYPVMFFLLQIWGLAYIPSLEGGIIQALLPIFTIVFAYFILNEKVNFKQGFCVVLSIGGIVFISMMKGVSAAEFSFLGSFLFVGSVLSSAVYNVLTRKYVSNYSLYDFTFIMTCFGFISFNLAAVAQHLVLGTFSLADFFAPFGSVSFIVSILYLGIPSSFLTGFLINYSLSKIEAARMSIFKNLSVVITIVVGYVVLGEAIYWYHIVGAVAIIAGVFGVNMFDIKKT